MVIGYERNQQDEEVKNNMTVRVLKNRFLGKTGVACELYYNEQTGRLLEYGAVQSQDGQQRREENY